MFLRISVQILRYVYRILRSQGVYRGSREATLSDFVFAAATELKALVQSFAGVARRSHRQFHASSSTTVPRLDTPPLKGGPSTQALSFFVSNYTYTYMRGTTRRRRRRRRQLPGVGRGGELLGSAMGTQGGSERTNEGVVQRFTLPTLTLTNSGYVERMIM